MLDSKSKPSTNGGSVILVADSDLNRLRAMAEFLTRQGHSCGTARDLSSAVARLRTGGYSLFVCDARIEGEASAQVLNKLARSCPHAPLILTSGSSTRDSAEVAFRRGVTKLLMNPYYLPRFHGVLAAAANGRA